MKIVLGGLKVAFLALGLTLVLTGCPPASTNTCKTDDDCTDGKVCNADGQCVEPTDKCAGVMCPGAQTCDPATGQCTGTCCTANTCTDPATVCDEDACKAGQNACVPKSCGDGPNNGCDEGFTCNARVDPPVCEPNCLRQYEGCPDADFLSCNEQTGACEQRPPADGEIGAPCESANDCDTGECSPFTRIQNFCTKRCQDDLDCPTGARCVENLLPDGRGLCFDVCDDSFQEDCAPGFQCVTDLVPIFSNGATEDFPVCWPLFDDGTCDPSSGNCVPNGGTCTDSSQCEPGSSCVEYGGGLALCQQIQCNYLTAHCDDGFTCLGLGNNLSACFENCDLTDPNACTGDLTCQQQPQIDSAADQMYLAVSAADCVAPYTESADFAGAGAVICYDGCTADADCGPGQFCTASTPFNGGPTINVCVNYDVKGTTCDSANCGTSGCTDLGGTNAVCYEACTSDADCTAAFGGRCTRLQFLSGDSINLCLYGGADAICFGGCTTDADCGYCETDDDCPEATSGQLKRQQICDQNTNTCVTPLNGVTEAATWCRTGWEFAENVAVDSQGNMHSTCRLPCDDDLDCDGACIPAAMSSKNGWCEVQPRFCNGPTGQCEAACAGDDSACIHGTCAAGDRGSFDRCVLGCTNATDDCGRSGVCDTTANYCDFDCTVAGCPSGSTCDNGSRACVPDPTIDTWTAGQVDLLGGQASAPVGTVTLNWATSNADSTALATAAVPASGSCADVAAADWTDEAAFPGTANGTYDLDRSASAENVCLRLTATGALANTEAVALLVVQPGVSATVTGAITRAAGGTVTVQGDVTSAPGDLTITAVQWDVAADTAVGAAWTVCDASTGYTSDTRDAAGTGQVTCTDTVAAQDLDANADEVRYTVQATDGEGDTNTDVAATTIQ